MISKVFKRNVTPFHSQYVIKLPDKYPAIQIVTFEDLLDGRQPKIPYADYTPFPYANPDLLASLDRLQEAIRGRIARPEADAAMT